MLSQDAVLIGEIERYVYVGRNEEKGVFSTNSQQQTRTRYGAISQYEVLYASAAVNNRLRGTIYIGPIDSKEEKVKGKRIYLLKRDRVGDMNQIGENTLYLDQDSLPIEKSGEMRDLSKMLERGIYDWRRQQLPAYGCKAVTSGQPEPYIDLPSCRGPTRFLLCPPLRGSGLPSTW